MRGNGLVAPDCGYDKASSVKPRPHDRAAPTGRQALPNHGVDNISVLGSIANG